MATAIAVPQQLVFPFAVEYLNSDRDQEEHEDEASTEESDNEQSL